MRATLRTSVVASFTVASLALASLAAGCASSAAPLGSTVLIGSFGSTQALLTADSASATIEYGCAAVVIGNPIVTGPDGSFATTGLRHSTAGPVPASGIFTGTPVQVTGRATSAGGGTVHLVVTGTQGSADVVTSDVVRGQPGNFPRCL